ncbi:MAG: ATP-binding protein [Chloroflexi bacterium]|nr:ATP-binding protein [Chloroflexota bacterium]
MAPDNPGFCDWEDSLMEMEVTRFHYDPNSYYALLIDGQKLNILRSVSIQPEIEDPGDFNTYMWAEAREGFFLFRQKFIENRPMGWVLESHVIPRKAVGFFEQYRKVLETRWGIGSDVPERKVYESVSEEPEKDEAPSDEPEAPAGIKNNKNASILVVDGDGATAAAFTELFGAGNEIVAADSAQEALEHLKKEHFDLVVTELKLHGKIPGEEFLEKLKELYPDIPTVIITGCPDVDTAVKALRNGAINFICKPMDTLQVQQILSRVLEMKQRLRNHVLTQEYVVSDNRIVIPSSLEHVKGVVNFFISRTVLADCYPHWILSQIQLALQEALINAMVHGNRLDSNKKIVINSHIDSVKFEIDITDEGQGFKTSILPDPSSETCLSDLLEHGRGIFLIQCSMDEVNFNRKGNSVHMVKYRIPADKSKAAENMVNK